MQNPLPAPSVPIAGADVAQHEVFERVGGSVSPPVVLAAFPPEFSEQARRAKLGGIVLVYLQVDINGRPKNVRVLRGVGFGLDERAVEAVKRYRFKPAQKAGKPVPVELNVEVNFGGVQGPTESSNSVLSGFASMPAARKVSA